MTHSDDSKDLHAPTMTDPLRAALDTMVDEVREATRILSDGYVITPEGAKRQAAAIDRIHLAVAAFANSLAADTARPTDHIFIHRQSEVVCAVAGCTHPPLAADTVPQDINADIEAEYYRQRGFGPGVPLYAKGPRE